LIVPKAGLSIGEVMEPVVNAVVFGDRAGDLTDGRAGELTDCPAPGTSPARLYIGLSII
jgi:hypothetical protein